MIKLIKRTYDIAFLTVTALVIAGCGGGGGGGSLGFLSDVAGSISGGLGSGGSVTGGSSSLVTVHHPEPSSILLLGSGLIGMAIYAKARLRGKGKR